MFEWFVYERHITSDHHTQSGIPLGVQYLAPSLHDPASFVVIKRSMNANLYIRPLLTPFYFSKILFTTEFYILEALVSAKSREK